MLIIGEIGCGIYGNCLYYLQFFFKSKTVLKQRVNLKEIKLRGKRLQA